MSKPYLNDLISSVVVFLVALPLCMGIAIASGMPPAAGLVTGIVGGILVGFLGGSPLQVSGPAAGLAVIVYEIVQQYGAERLGPVLLIAGLIQIAAGALKLGGWFRAISPPVVYGMLAGIGVLIFGSQFHVMVDDKPKGSGLLNLFTLPSAVGKGLLPLDQHSYAAIIGIVTIAALLIWPKIRPAKFRFVPGVLIGAIVGTAIAQVFQLQVHYVDLPSNLLSTLKLPSPSLILPAFLDVTTLLEAVALALVASAETMLSAVAVDRMHSGPRARFDRELLAQGFGNTLCGGLGALPMTGVIVRSAANVEAGAKTQWPAILHGFWILGSVLFLPWLLKMIPSSCLAAILVYTGFKLVNFDNFRELSKLGGRVAQAIYLLTVGCIVGFDLLTGVMVGLGASIAWLLYRLTHLSIQEVRHEQERRVDLLLKGAATFVALPKLAPYLDNIPRGWQLHIHFEDLSHIDHACLDAFENWEKQHKPHGSRLVVEWEHLFAKASLSGSNGKGNGHSGGSGSMDGGSGKLTAPEPAVRA